MSASTIAAPGAHAAAPACAACGGRRLRELGRIEAAQQHRTYAAERSEQVRRLDTLLAGSFCMLRCEGCGLEFADPLHAPSGDWYAALYDALDLYPQERWEYGVVRAALAPGQVLLDYGCGSGHFLAGAAPRVARAVGIDFAPSSIGAAAARGLEAHLAAPGGAPPAGLPPARHVTAFHVLEHLPDPAALLRFARRAGTPDVRLWIAVPSDRRASRRYGEFDALDAPPHHLTRWTQPALEALAAGEGWRVEQFRYEPLARSTALWEATRRTRAYARLEPVPGAPRRLLRRLLAAGVGLAGRHRMRGASGFSMLASLVPAAGAAR